LQSKPDDDEQVEAASENPVNVEVREARDSDRELVRG
jgi:hypothetical protein